MAQVTIAKLRKILARRLKLSDPVFMLERFGRRVSGSVIDDKFFGMDDLKRQKAIRVALEMELGKDSTGQVGMILAFTPDEWDMPLEGTRKKRNGHRLKAAK
jgi:acid stress-induced BolA-like protein IbaG/YrbA